MYIAYLHQIGHVQQRETFWSIFCTANAINQQGSQKNTTAHFHALVPIEIAPTMKFPTLTLPDDALICVFCFLPARTLLESVQLVSKRFKELASIDWIWRGIYKKSFAYSLLHHDQISNLMMDEEEESTTAFKLSYIYKSNLEKNWKNSSTCDFVPQALRVSQFQAKIDTTQMGAKGIHCLKYVRRSPSSQYTGNPDALDIFVGCGPNICLYRCLYKAEQEACEEILEEDQNDEAAALMSREIETCRAVKLQEYKGHNLMVWCMDINYNRMKDKLVSSGIDDRYEKLETSNSHYF